MIGWPGSRPSSAGDRGRSGGCGARRAPRSTRDADFVIEATPGHLANLGNALPPGLTLQRQGSFEAATGTTRYVIELADSPFVCELFLRSDDAHDRERFGRRQRVRLLERVAFVATAEDMIVTKLRWSASAKTGGREAEPTLAVDLD